MLACLAYERWIVQVADKKVPFLNECAFRERLLGWMRKKMFSGGDCEVKFKMQGWEMEKVCVESQQT